METKVIGLTGKKRSGKDSVFKIIQEQYPGACRIAFADALKEEFAAALNEPLQLIEERKDVFRVGLQWFGSNYKRELYGADYWIKQAEIKYNRCLAAQPCAVIFTDCRFPNEVDLIRNLGGRLWRITRPGYDGDQHISETALDGYCPDFTLTNSGSLEQLAEIVLRAAREDFGIPT